VATIGFVLSFGPDCNAPTTLGFLLISVDGAYRGCSSAPDLIGTCQQWMSLQPKRTGSNSRINASICPPGGFVARTMDLTVMAAAQWHGEFIAGFAPECALLHETQMMRIRWLAATNETGLFGHKPHMIPVANAARLRIEQVRLVDACGPELADRFLCLSSVGARRDHRRVSVGPIWCAFHHREPSLKGFFNLARICGVQRVLRRKNTLSQYRGVFSRLHAFEFADQLIAQPR
jgi:hypothetical protein